MPSVSLGVTPFIDSLGKYVIANKLFFFLYRLETYMILSEKNFQKDVGQS